MNDGYEQSQRQGLLPRLRWRLFGEPDTVTEQLKDIARQGTGMARIAHMCAFLLIVLFSLGSLVALSGSAVVEVASLGAQPHTIPAAISAAVSTLLVTCMDVALVYAAAMLRILDARRAQTSEKRVHVAVLVCASLLEASTYVYMAALYDRTPSAAGWALVVARALAAPLFGVYLSMARPLPVGPRDILYQVELGTGRGVIRDAVKIANDMSAPLERKMALYGASAVMTDGDRARLARMIAAMERLDMPPWSGLPFTDPLAHGQAAALEVQLAADPIQVSPELPRAPRVDLDHNHEPPPRPPTGGGPPNRAKRRASKRRRTEGKRPAVIPLAPPAEERIRAALALEPGLSVRALARRAGTSESTASKYRRLLQAEVGRDALHRVPSRYSRETEDEGSVAR